MPATLIKHAEWSHPWEGSIGTYRVAAVRNPGSNRGFTLTAYVGCPTCGGISSLSDHRIDKDGAVTPSVVCTRLRDGHRCGFHETVRLEGWAEHSRAMVERLEGERAAKEKR